MTEHEQPQPESSSTLDLSDLQELVRLIGQVVSNASLYGPAHKVVRHSLETCFMVLEIILNHCESLTFATTDDALIVDGREIDTTNPLVSSLVKQILALDVGGFVLARGITLPEFGKLIELFSTPPDKVKGMGESFGAVLRLSGITNVESKSVSYKLVADEDLVVNKGELAEQLAAGGKGAGAGGDTSDAEKERPISVDQIVAFLKGDVLPDANKAIDGLREAASDPAMLADLILKTAQIQQRAARLEGGDSLADFVVGCIHRTYDALLESPAAKTQQGKRDLSKAVMLLEKSILDKLRSMTAVTESALSAISDAVEEINSELAIEAISSEYMKKRIALENTESKVLRFLKKTERKPGASEALREKLVGGGLSLEGWKEIVVKSGAGSAPGGGISGAAGAGRAPGAPDGMRGIGMLAMLLSKLDEMMGTIKRVEEADAPNPDLSKLVKDIEREVTQVAAKTEQKVDDLAATVAQLEKIKDDVSAARDAAVHVTKWKETVAEIVQELWQLITVISSALQMIRSGRLGDVSRDQAEMLTLATSSSDRLKHLSDRLFAISSVPTTLEPDTKLLRSLFK